MRIDKKFNIVIPVESDSGTIYVHSTPLRREVFEKYFLIISKTFAGIYSHGLNIVAGPRIAYMMLKQIAIEEKVWEGGDGIENGLMNEVRRISTVLLPSENGWTLTPLQDAINKQALNQEEIDEIEGSIIFFICASAIHRRTDLEAILNGLQDLWGTQTTLLNCTEFRNSLRPSTDKQTSTPAAFQETVKQSSIPT